VRAANAHVSRLTVTKFHLRSAEIRDTYESTNMHHETRAAYVASSSGDANARRQSRQLGVAYQLAAHTHSSPAATRTPSHSHCALSYRFSVDLACVAADCSRCDAAGASVDATSSESATASSNMRASLHIVHVIIYNTSDTHALLRRRTLRNAHFDVMRSPLHTHTDAPISWRVEPAHQYVPSRAAR
jgi:hypothetical protein